MPISRWLLITLVPLGWSSAKVSWQAVSEHNPVQEIDISQLRPLSAPRSDISLGARWQQGVGPIDAGVASDRWVKVGGITESTLRTREQLHAGILATLSRRFGLGASGQTTAAKDLRIDSAEFVRVRDIASLTETVRTGTSFVWEGLRVKQFSFTDVENREAELQAHAESDSTHVVSLQAGGTHERRYTVKGANLFVAYRVITFAAPNVRILATVHFRGHSPNANIGTSYSVTFTDEKSEKCAGQMIVNDFTNPESRTARIPVWCEGVQSVSDRFDLGLHPVGDGQARDELLLTNVTPVRNQHGPGLRGVNGWVQVMRRTYPIQTLQNPLATGW